MNLLPETLKQIEELGILPVGRNINIQCLLCGEEYVTAEPDKDQIIQCCKCGGKWQYKLIA